LWRAAYAVILPAKRKPNCVATVLKEGSCSSVRFWLLASCWRGSRYGCRPPGLSTCPDPSLVSLDITQGKVIRHFQRVGQTIEELKNLIEPAEPALQPHDSSNSPPDGTAHPANEF